MYEPQQYIPVRDLTGEELDELVEDGSVNIEGHIYAAWRSDASGPWVKLLGEAKPEPAGGQDYPEIHGVSDDRSWFQKRWDAILGIDGGDDDVV